MANAWTDNFDAIPDSVLVEAGLPMAPRHPRGMLSPDKRTLVCARCWTTFDGSSRTQCPQCSGARPEHGWPSLPYSFRDRYLFSRVVGRGGMGAVFLAFDEHQLDESKRAVAVKVVPTAGSPSLREALKRMFEREAAAAAMLAQSPHFVKVTSHDVGVEPAYLVMEYVDWPTLRGLLKRGQGATQPLTPVKAARIGVALLRGLSAMHFHRIVHRDLKPDNVFVRRSESGEDYDVKILDLGVWTYDATTRAGADSLPGLPKPDEGAPVGTFAYMSPEQMMQQPIGAASDLHTAASVLWELVTGEVPYPLARRELTAAMRERVERMRTLPTKPACMPEGLYEVLSKALAFAPRDRWASADDMRSALKTWLAQTLRWTQSAVVETKSRLSVMEQEADALLRRLSPAQALVSELESLRDRLRADQRHADEVSLEALAEAQQRSDRAFRSMSEKLSAFAEAVHQGVIEGEAATGDVPPMEVGADGVPVVAAGPSVELDLGADDDGPEDSRKTAAPPARRSSQTSAVEPSTAEARARWRLRGAAVAGLVGLGVAVGAVVLAATGPSAPAKAATEVAPPSTPPVPAATHSAAPTLEPTTVVVHARDLGADPDAALDTLLGAVHTGGHASIAWSPDGARLASGSADGVVRVWDAKSGAPLARVPVLEGGAVHALAWTPDGTTLALTSADGGLRLWDARSKTITGIARAHARPARALALTPDGRAIITGGDDGAVRVWSSASAELLTELELAAPKKKAKGGVAHGAITALAADDQRIVARYADGTVMVWTERGLGAPITKAPGEATSLALPPRGDWLALGGPEGSLTLADLGGKLAPRTLAAQGSPLTALAASSDGRRLAAAHADRTVRLWEIEGGAASASLAGARAAVEALAFSPDGRRVVAGTADGGVILWDAATGAVIRRLDPRSGATRAVTFDDGGAVVVGAAVSRVDPATGARLTRLDAGTQGARIVATSRDARHAVSIGEAPEAQLVELATGVLGRRLPLSGRAAGAAVAPDGAWVAVATDDDRVRVWASDSGDVRLDLTLAGARAVAASPDGASLAVTGLGAVEVWSIASARKLQTVAVSGAPSAVAWSTDGGLLAVGTDEGRVARIDADSGALTTLARPQGAPVRALAFAPDGRTLAIGGLGTTLELAPLAEGAAARTLGGHALGVTALAFSEDGAHLAAGVADGTTRLHDLARGEARTVAESGERWLVIAD